MSDLFVVEGAGCVRGPAAGMGVELLRDEAARIPHPRQLLPVPLPPLTARNQSATGVRRLAVERARVSPFPDPDGESHKVKAVVVRLKADVVRHGVLVRATRELRERSRLEGRRGALGSAARKQRREVGAVDVRRRGQAGQRGHLSAPFTIHSAERINAGEALQYLQTLSQSIHRPFNHN